MTYTRCDVNCDPKPIQPQSTLVSDRCSGYLIWNTDYKRADKDCDNTVTQPDILSGWNADYVPVTPGKANSQDTVLFNVYVRTDVNCVATVPAWKDTGSCYIPTNIDNQPVIIQGVYTEAGLYLVTQSGTPNYPDLVIIPEASTP